jgi:hypothetical protein
MKFDTSIILATLAAAAVAAPAPYDGVARRYVDTTGNKLPAEYAASVRRMVSEKANNKRQLDQLLGGLLGGKGDAGAAGAGAGAGGAGGLAALLGGAGGNANAAGAGNAAGNAAGAGNAAANGKAKGNGANAGAAAGAGNAANGKAKGQAKGAAGAGAGAVSLHHFMKYISRLISTGCGCWWCSKQRHCRCWKRRGRKRSREPGWRQGQGQRCCCERW